jgi:hypothetical protein
MFRATAGRGGLYIPTLETLCYNLEAANSHPSFALDHLRDLAFDVEKMSEHLELIDEHFAKGRNEQEIVRSLLNYELFTERHD